VIPPRLTGCPAVGSLAGSVLAQLGVDLGPGADTELVVDPGEVGLHGADAHEQRVGDLLVGQARADELGDPLLGGGEVPGWGAASDPAELRPRPVGPKWSAELLKACERTLERGPGGAPRERASSAASSKVLATPRSGLSVARAR